MQEIMKNLMFLKQRYYEGGSMKMLFWKLQNTIHKIKVTKITKTKLNEIQGAFETL